MSSEGKSNGGGAAAAAPAAAAPTKRILSEVLPKAGLVYSEKGNLNEVLCKPKILPIKSATMVRLEELEANAANVHK